MAGVFVNQVNSFNPQNLDLERYEQSIYDLTGRNVSLSETFTTLGNALKQDVRETFPRFVTFTSNFLLSTFVMFFVMFYLLIEKDRFINMVRKILPFSKKNSNKLIDESGKVTKAILIGQVLTAIIQGLLGMFSFLIVGINGAFFWGIIMIILSIIPVIGVFLVWVPAGIILLLEGQIWQGIFVLVWGALVVSQIDNIVRPKLVNKFAKIHPLETFLGVIIGLTTFGIVGLILGPLIVSLFRTLISVYVIEYVE
jgi:predicted PurR-regulated permease PerM